jgi:hypothetical protein
MRSNTVVVSTTGVSSPIPMNLNTSPFNIGFGCIVSATATYTVQHTFDDVFSSSFDPSTATWFNHSSVASATTNQDGNYAFPVKAIRLNVAANTGTVTLIAIQAGIQ